MHRIRVHARLGHDSSPRLVARALCAVDDVRAELRESPDHEEVVVTVSTADPDDVVSVIDLIWQVDPEARPTSVQVLTSVSAA